jgi:cytochrome c oxidase subunit 2
MSAAAPLGYLDAAGQRAQAVLPLTWWTLVVSILVCLIIAALLWFAVRRAVSNGGAAETRATAVQRGHDGLKWISVGVGISAVPLLVTLVWTMVALGAVSGPPRHPGLVLDITAHQWWWAIQYDSERPNEVFSTANEIHIPVGVPVLVRLHGDDVIHSFWVPKLTGKTDTIPGQTNLSWMQARLPGRYSGQCSEFCGLQHAHMGLEVVAQPMRDFAAWRQEQLRPAPSPQTAEQTRGMNYVVYRCGLCHQVRGTDAGAVTAPDLTHVMGRAHLAAGTLPNGVGTLAAWIENPQGLKPGSLMPNQNLTAQQLSDTLAYLELLQ